MNRLAKESSPYLLQHANNPVDWYAFNDEAIAKARSENKPILLSIGYAACHWCHVMAHESFEDPDTAKIMNELFINIKVDREERPDLDKIYQTTHYLLTNQHGGWPLTVFLAPNDLAPFFSGTYFPREAKYQLPSFKELLKLVANVYQTKSLDVKEQNEKLIKVLNHSIAPMGTVRLDLKPLESALQSLRRSFDQQHGGFGGAPKFPHPTKLEFLINSTSSTMAFTTLNAMGKGGIYDQLLGGFFRYTVDAQWRIPHFEKMLYDNAQLLALYSSASGHSPLFSTIAKQTADFIIEKMQSPEGGFYSSFDADSEGHEGQYYVWSKEEIRSTLNDSEYSIAETHFGLSQPPNFEGKYHLYVAHATNDTALKNIIQKLLAVREQRVPPHCDTKILTSWNSLMIKALAITSEKLQEPRYFLAAQRSLDYIYKNFWQNKTLLTTHNIPAYLDDYAYLLDALITLLKINWQTNYLQWAIELADAILLHFPDKKLGGSFFTSDTQQEILYRPKVMLDEATPAGNGIAAQALLTLGYLLGETRYIDAAEKTVKAAWPILPEFPAEHCSLLMALKKLLDPAYLVVIRGTPEDIKKWHIDSFHHDVFAIPTTEANLPGLLNSKVAKNSICAYVCQGMECLPVIEDFVELKERLTL